MSLSPSSYILHIIMCFTKNLVQSLVLNNCAFHETITCNLWTCSPVEGSKQEHSQLSVFNNDIKNYISHSASFLFFTQRPQLFWNRPDPVDPVQGALCVSSRSRERKRLCTLHYFEFFVLHFHFMLIFHFSYLFCWRVIFPLNVSNGFICGHRGTLSAYYCC